jgi:hypothetical protein
MDAVVKLVIIPALTAEPVDKIVMVAGKHPDAASFPLKTSPSSPFGELASLRNHRLSVNSENSLFLEERNGDVISSVELFSVSYDTSRHGLKTVADVDVGTLQLGGVVEVQTEDARIFGSCKYNGEM